MHLKNARVEEGSTPPVDHDKVGSARVNKDGELQAGDREPAVSNQQLADKLKDVP
jgi:hypothetical protein